ncbi:MAG: formylglycine-generating enzyme family protein [Leptospiraceae bacterium]|nr:formylglycine-generating enzyme family protein [Leptospiraceae bacterium]
MKDYHGCTRINTDKRFRIFVYISLYLYICGITFPLLSSELVKVPAGVYKPFIKVDAESATKPIPVKSFYLDKYLVTKKDYSEFISKNPKWKKENTPQIFADEGYLDDWKTKKENFILDSPVTYISWFSAKAYCESQGKRLPNAYEWEYAAFIPPIGGNSKTVDKEIMRWYGEKKPDHLPSIGRYKNALGIYDLHGLIWEWVYDFNSASVTGDSRADSDLESSLFCGAGALKANDFSNYAAYMRFGYRAGLKGWYTGKYLGFRCAKDL